MSKADRLERRIIKEEAERREPMIARPNLANHVFRFGEGCRMYVHGVEVVPVMSDEAIRERTPEEKLDHLIEQFALLSARVARLEREILPQDPDPDIGLP